MPLTNQSTSGDRMYVDSMYVEFPKQIRFEDTQTSVITKSLFLIHSIWWRGMEEQAHTKWLAKLV